MEKELYVLYEQNEMPKFLYLTKGEASLVEEILDFVSDSVGVDFDKITNYDIFEVKEN